MNIKNFVIVSLAAIIAGLVIGLVMTISWEVVAVIMAASMAVTILLYAFSPARSLAWVSGMTTLVTIGMAFATAL